VLVGFFCALLDERPPRLSLVLPGLLVAGGFAVSHLPAYGLFHVDSPVAILHDYLRESTGSLNGARALLVGATVVLTVLFVQGSVLIPRRYLSLALALLTLVVLPLQSAYAFVRLFEHDGTSGRPVSVAQGGFFNWLDRTVSPDADVTLVPYPGLPGEYWASVAAWWDLEFWNRSATHVANVPGQYEWTPSTFPRFTISFDPRTGRANASPTRYVAQSDRETRFRLAGPAIAHQRDTLLIDAEKVWRADWLTFGLSDDGWTTPRTTARIRVFSAVWQKQGGVTRSLRIGLRAPADVPERGVELTSNLEHVRDRATNGWTLFRTLEVCVPAGGYSDVSLDADGFSQVYGDMRDESAIGLYREGGVLLVQVALADEAGPPCRPRHSS
jgi:hypothetical protein